MQNDRVALGVEDDGHPAYGRVDHVGFEPHALTGEPCDQRVQVFDLEGDAPSRVGTWLDILGREQGKAAATGQVVLGPHAAGGVLSAGETQRPLVKGPRTYGVLHRIHCKGYFLQHRDAPAMSWTATFAPTMDPRQARRAGGSAKRKIDAKSILSTTGW